MFPDIETIQAYVALIKDIITGLSAATAAVIAILGLQAWKKQLKGKTEYELAQRLLRTVYKIREAFSWVRNPYQSPDEIFQAMKEAGIEGDPLRDPIIRARGEGAVYRRRWKEAQNAIMDLETLALEAEAVWGSDAKDSLKPLRQCSAVLWFNIKAHLQNLEVPTRSNNNADAQRQINDIIYYPPDNPENNHFSKEITEAVKIIEDFLKPHLKL
jgi:hypothetical protein